MKKKLIMTGFLAALMVFLLPVIVFAWPVPDTGQATCYDAGGSVIPCPTPGQHFYGQDANYTINPPSYTKLDSSGNPLPDDAASWVMVKDNVTRLIWEVKQDKDDVKNYSNPHDADNTYTWYDSNPDTNGGDAGRPGDGTDTEDFINALNIAHFGEYSDWRLPTRKELRSIVDYSIYPGRCINTSYFPDTPLGTNWNWSSDTCAYNTNNAWGMYFHNGDVFGNGKGGSAFVRAVRGGQTHSAYVDNLDGTVTDTSTGLTWQQATAPGVYSWEAALAYCEDLTLGGWTDWRLPTYKELDSIVDLTRWNPAINTDFFPDTPSSNYWSSTTYAHYNSNAWQLYFLYGHGDDRYGPKDQYDHVRAVRGGPSGAIDPLPYLVISAISPQQVDVPFFMTVEAKDGYGNTMMGFNGTVYLTSSLGCMNPSSVCLVNGTATINNVTLYYGGNGTISASGNGLYGQSNAIDVTGPNPGYGKLAGYVRDTNKNPVDGATVYLDSLTQTTNAKGYFEFTDLPCKMYSLYAKAPDESQSKTSLITIGPSNPFLTYINIPSYVVPGKIPILLVPGIMGSSIGGNTLFDYPSLPKGSPAWNSVVWNTESYGLYDPDLVKIKYFVGWRKLIEDLKSHGYEMGSNLFAVPYDWRMPIEQSTEKYLKAAIQDVKDKTHSTKVHIIAHSMGGLLTRYYIQKYDKDLKHYGGDDIAKFAMVGTPNYGSATPYYIWFGGDPKLADDVTDGYLDAAFNLYSNTIQNLYRTMNDGEWLFPYDVNHIDWYDSGAKLKAKEFVQEHGKSMRQLLSTEDFLVDSGPRFGLERCNQNNLFLEDLNQNIDFHDVDVKLFAGNNQLTILFFGAWLPNDTYCCGVPMTVVGTNEGDGTVTLSSARGANTIDVTEEIIPSSHAALIKNCSDGIISFITGDLVQAQVAAKAISAEIETTPPVLNLNFYGPVSPYLVSPSGKKLGFDPSTGSMVNDFDAGDMKMDCEAGFMSIENPEQGTYTLSLKSDYQRNFQGDIGYADDTQSDRKPFAAFIENDVFTISFTLNPSNPAIISMEPQLTSPEDLQVEPFENNGLKTHLTWSPGTQQTIIGYKVYSRLIDEPYLSLLWSGAQTSFITDHDWAGSSDITPRLYAISAVLSDGTETLLSDMVKNNDRDRDGLTDAEETDFGSDMTKADTEGDGLTDSEEYLYGTSPLLADTDGDGFSDKIEIDAGSDPLDKDSVPPKQEDIDGDGDVDIVDIMKVAARWNTATGDPNYDASCDLDGDGDIDIIDVMKVAAQWGWTAV